MGIRVREAQGAIETGKRSQRSYNVSAEGLKMLILTQFWQFWASN